jgi:hypothetical protein
VNQPLVPAAVLPGGPGFTLTVNGTGFTSQSIVRWNGCVRETSFVSSSRLTAAILESDVSMPGTASVTVYSPSPGGGTSNVVFLHITNPCSVELSESQVSTGAGPLSVAVGDLDGDGKLDLVTANYTDNTVSILLSGDLCFEPHVDYPVQGYPRSVTTGDFNGDGALDLAVATQAGVVSILLGNGDGTFQTHQDFMAGTLATHVITADFNRDGRLDLGVADAAFPSGPVLVLLGNGDGTFQSARSYEVGGYVYGLATGDFNGDGILDLAATVTGGASISILLGNGDGTFTVAGNYPLAGFPVSVVAADFNGDNTLDLAVAVTYPPTNTVSILLGNGDGTFQSCGDYGSTGFPFKIVTGDFDGDGKLDLAVTEENLEEAFLSILLGNGDGTFQCPREYPFGRLGTPSLAIADFNDDGKLDLVTTNEYCDTVSLWLQAPPQSR